jgi:hypothetical protein
MDKKLKILKYLMNLGCLIVLLGGFYMSFWKEDNATGILLITQSSLLALWIYVAEHKKD